MRHTTVETTVPSPRWPRRASAIAIAALAFTGAPPPVSASPAEHRPPGSLRGAELYQRACSTCHAMDGRGRSQNWVGFSNPLPDFTDCDFASREPDADWDAITHGGGPMRGFVPLMPAFEEALDDEQIHQILAHVRSFCRDPGWPRGELNLPRPFVTEKAFPEDEAVVTTSTSLEGPAVVTNELVYERRFGARNQVELVFPFGFLERDGGFSGGRLGDASIGVKRALYHDLDKGSIFSASGELKLPTGDAEGGFGTGTTAFEPFLAFGQLLPAGMFLHLQAGIELPFDTESAAREAFWRMVPGKSFSFHRFGRTWSPMVEVLGQRELEEDAEVEWDLLPQLQIALSRRQHILASLGVRVPLTQRSERDPSLLVYLLWDFYDGGFLEGW